MDDGMDDAAALVVSTPLVDRNGAGVLPKVRIAVLQLAFNPFGVFQPQIGGAWREPGNTPGDAASAEWGAPPGIALRGVLTLGGRFHKSHQVVPPERLGEKSSCAPAHRFFTIRLSSLCADKYDRHPIVRTGKSVLQFEACYARQLYVDDQAGSFPRRSGSQKLLGRIEALNVISRRLHAVSQRLPHKHVIIDDRDATVQYVAHLIPKSPSMLRADASCMNPNSGAGRGLLHLSKIPGQEEILSFSAIRTSSANDPAPILLITRPRCTLIVSSVVPSSPAICLFKRPVTTSART
jgi:hypothetical protein